MRSAIIAIICIIAAVAVTATPIPFKNCATSTPIMAVSGIEGTFPFVRGVPLNITVSGVLSSTVSSGTYNLEVKLFGTLFTINIISTIDAISIAAQQATGRLTNE
jgi:hypothetical protein